jgi:hypothetical protein
MGYLERYGLPRRPRWVIVEVVPSIDFLDSRNPAPLLSQQAVVPLIQGLWRRFHPGSGNQPGENAVYPLAVDLPDRTLPLTCCLHYLEFFTLDSRTIRASRDWTVYRRELLNLIGAAQSGGACVALLYAPTKPDIYFPLASKPDQLKPTLGELSCQPWNGREVTTRQRQGNREIRSNVFAERYRTLAQEQGLVWIDPTESFVKSVLVGEDPFMVYDSHWNAIGHQLVAQAVAEGISAKHARGACP